MDIVGGSNRPETRALELRKDQADSSIYSSKSGPYFRFDVPDSVENLVYLSDEGDIKGVEAGHNFFISVEEETGLSGQKIEYLRYDPVRGPDPLTLSESGKKEGAEFPYILRVPTQFVKPGNESPFAGYTLGDKINLEVDFLNNVLRVYRVEDYHIRYEKLLSIDKPPLFKGIAAIPLHSAIRHQTDENSNYSQRPPTDAFDIFEIRPFNSASRNLLQIIESNAEKYSKTYRYTGRTEVDIGIIHDFINQLQSGTNVPSKITVSHRVDQQTVKEVTVQGLASFELYIPKQGSTKVSIRSPVGNNAIEFIWSPPTTKDADWGVVLSGSMTKSIDFLFKERNKYIVHLPVPKKVDKSTQEEIFERELSDTGTSILGTTFEWTGVQVV